MGIMTSRLTFWLVLLGVAVASAGMWLWTSSQRPTVGSRPSQAVIGETASLFDGDVATWSRFSADGTVTAVGATVQMATVRNAPVAEPHTDEDAEEGHQHAETHSVRLDLPKTARKSTFFDHLQIDYNPAGHPPAPYERAHFDFHFYGIDTSEQLAIDCTDRTMPPEALVPSGYQVLPPKPESEGGGCVPEMGNHAIDVNAPELREENPQPFTKTMILGYYGGHLTFLEPMVTKQFLMRRDGFAMAVPVPERLDRSTRYPTSFEAIYDAEEVAYRLIWSDFVALE